MEHNELFSLLACPICKNDLTVLHDGSGLVCYVCSLQFPIIEGIPDLLVQDAKEI
jgi:uncharacterized protein YbaR (Trm112 family)